MSKIVTKHWGHELWIADGTNTPYALKRILFRAGNQTSLQVHKFKVETNYVLSGSGILYLSPFVFDIDDYLKSNILENHIKDYEKTFNVVELYEGVIFTVLPGTIHRVVAKTDLEFMEVSTTELDDVIRLIDDKNRSHGKIKEEHE